MKKRIWLFAALTVVGCVVIAAWILHVRSSDDVSNPFTGLVVAASADSVSIQPDTGQSVTFVNRAHNVSIEHLHEHRIDREPVSVTWYQDGNDKVATLIEDVHEEH